MRFKLTKWKWNEDGQCSSCSLKVEGESGEGVAIVFKRQNAATFYYEVLVLGGGLDGLAGLDFIQRGTEQYQTEPKAKEAALNILIQFGFDYGYEDED